MAGGIWESTLVIIQNTVSKRCTGYYSNTQMFRQETNNQFYTWPSVVLTRHYSKKEKEEKKICAGLKASEFASPAIKAVLTPNMDPARNEDWNLLTLPLGINHMHTNKKKQKTKNAQNANLPDRLSEFANFLNFEMTNLNMMITYSEKHLLLERKRWTFGSISENVRA